jgi:hypothetical protein
MNSQEKLNQLIATSKTLINANKSLIENSMS